MLSSPLDTERGRARPTSVLSPTRGLNTVSPLAGLAQNYALAMDNFLCQPDGCALRRGSEEFLTGFPSPPRTLADWAGPFSKKMFAFSNGGVFDASGGGTVGAPDYPLTQGYVQAVNFGTSGGHFLVVVNGQDPALNYNGTVWSEPAITGVDPAELCAVEVYRSRLFFIANHELGFRYLPVDSIAGAAPLFRIGAICRRGGYAVCIGTWSIDGGNGPDDYFAIATSEGEVAIFRGSDPSDPDNWFLLNVYYIGKPSGRNAFEKFGGDLLYLSEGGVFPLSKALQSVAVDYKQAVTNEIEPTIRSLVKRYPMKSKWQMTTLPSESLVLVNTPTAPGTQFVFNTKTKGWSRLKAWDATYFLEWDGAIYYAGTEGVFKCFTGRSDNGAPIEGLIDTAYNRFGTPVQQRPLLMRALIAANGPFTYSLGFATDYSNIYEEQDVETAIEFGALWDVAEWDVSLWSGAYALEKSWQTIAVNGGITLSTRFRVSTSTVGLSLLAFDYSVSPMALVQ